MFKLLRYFSIASLLAFAVVVTFLGVYYRRIATSEMIEVEENLNAALTQAFANSLWPEFRPLVDESYDLSDKELRTHGEVPQLRSAVLMHMEGLSVVKVKVYNLDGLTVFSTEESQIGDDKSKNAGFLEARSGSVVSELTHRDTFSAFEQTIEDRDVFSSYLPIQPGGADGEIEGVFELYSDVTPLLQRIDREQRNVLLVVSFSMIALYLVLFAIVRHADGIIRRQYHERREALRSLRDQRESLQERTAELVDVNGRLQFEIEERGRAEAAMLRSQKLESLGVLAGGIAHDFNNLLAAIMGQSTVALAKLRPESEARIHIERAVNASERAATLADQLLAYSGRGKIEIAAVALNTLIEEHIDLIAVSLPKAVSIYTDLATPLPYIMADVAQLQQIIINLLANASDAIGEEPGTVSIETRVRKIGQVESAFESQLTGDPLEPGDYVELMVSDTGAGMDAETLARIFDPFFSTKFTGRGLGLAAVLGIVRGHSGGIYVESEPAEGSMFRLLFPAMEKIEFEGSSGPGSGREDTSAEAPARHRR